MDLPVVAPLTSLTPARDRCLPVEPALARLFPDAGLRRGHVIGCGGIAARTLGLAVATRAVVDGAWLAVVGIDDFGVEAAVELGIPAERVVTVAASSQHEWAERVAAAADGFELILTVPPPGAARAMRKVRQRLQARGSVLVTVPPTAVLTGGTSGSVFGDGVDIEINADGGDWVGIGDGHGRLTARRVEITASGRRVPRPVTLGCWLPGPDGRIDIVQTGHIAHDERDVECSDVVSRAS